MALHVEVTPATQETPGKIKNPLAEYWNWHCLFIKGDRPSAQIFEVIIKIFKYWFSSRTRSCDVNKW
jgi:hypothetical protein